MTTKTTKTKTVIPMAEFPSFEDATETVQSAAHQTKRKVLWWLPEPLTCEKCGLQCEPSRAYSIDEAAFYAEHNGKVPTWYCESCETHYRRMDE